MKNKLLFLNVFSIFVFKSIFADKTSQGKTIYDAQCLMCHGTTGKGDGSVGRNLSKKVPLLKPESTSQIVKILNAGKIGLMPDFRTSLNSDQKNAVAKYIMDEIAGK